MSTYKMIIEYDGAAFHGWQIQQNASSVQETLQKALKTITKTDVKIQGAGRTDAGVHAVGQAASFELETELSEQRLQKGLCALCRPHIAVLDLHKAHDSFNARFDALGKHYRYRLMARPSPPVLHRATSWHVFTPLDLAAMQSAATLLEGENDFAAFRASDDERENTRRTISSVICRPHSEDNGIWDIHVRGNAFLKNMVRIIAGTLVDVGLNKLSAKNVLAALQTGDRNQAGRTAPACGLTLIEVFYPSINS